MSINTNIRTEIPEIMDDLSLDGPELIATLDEIELINKRLGGHAIIKNGIKKLVKDTPKERILTIADIGCGNGGTLRMLDKYAKRHELNFSLTGIDANPHTIAYAQELSKNYTNIEYKCLNILEPTFQQETYDIILCTLTLHHFQEDQIFSLMNDFDRKTSTGVIINDLHRSKIAYILFRLVSWVFRLNPMAKEDGLASILRGFKKHELMRYAQELNFKNYSIHWKWAFRYQWIITKK